ncbi:hypothetical protein [Thauera linaloolentis]|uniref:DUF4351 domain-containing protein n=1 Tax=Thauera linaloolentis (strain DSM 12138 / JCM 21573 / CCUG 41526 / CIP 105981 / IAM 15112 / NBRC 102519 / 47Lol) TaxID=1123367 RepID=N6XPW2_THAL4|nr:hypothetical protein [Thauera linaloolentis]ENO83736.1 hypothetical protein C666_18520 [Thauera linaloolentis 47Lol = DSM 12138]MCM8566551.1 DUF4351 domain-containing protein [Thauera linaloolentis]
MSPPAEDHDSPWKEALECFFRPFLQLLYPDIEAAIDWNRPVAFLDKELQKIAPTSRNGRRHVDKLARVHFHAGAVRWLLIHVEVQGERETAFPERMFLYYHRIRDHHRQHVISLAVLTDTDPNWRPGRFRETLAGSGVEFRFRTAKLLDLQPRLDELLATDNPFALLAAAQLTAKLVKGGKQRVDNLIGFYRLALKKQLDPETIARLLRFVEWLVALPAEIEPYYTEQMDRLKEENTVPYVSILERKATERGLLQGLEQGMEQGLEQGMERGRVATLSRQLQLKFGPLSDNVRERLDKAGEAELDSWTERILFAETLEGVFGD